MKALRNAWTWVRSHRAPVLGVSVPGIIVAAIAFRTPSFPVPEGHLFTVARPKAADGSWLDADRIANLVREALDRTLGPPRPLGSGSYPLKKWRDKTSDGKSYDVRAGIWLTELHAAPAGSPWEALSLKVHFWIELHGDGRSDGDLHLAVVARGKPPAGGPEVDLDRAQTEAVIAALLSHLK